MKRFGTAAIVLLALAAFAADPVAPPKRRNLDTVMISGTDDGADSVVQSFGPGGESRCATKPNTACGACNKTCPVGNSAVCVVGVPSSEFVSGVAGTKCARPPSCTCE